MEAKQWRCKNGHILGSIQWNGSKVPYLALYRHAIDPASDCPESVDVIGALKGQMPVTCDAPECGDVRLWDLSVDALAEFLGGLNKVQREQLEARLRKGKVKRATRYKNKAKVNQ